MTRKRVNPLALTCPIIDTQNLSVSEDDPKTGRPSAICIQGSQAILRPVDDEDVVDFWEDLVASYDYRHSLLYCKTILVISLQGCLWRSFVVTVNHLNFATILRHIISRLIKNHPFHSDDSSAGQSGCSFSRVVMSDSRTYLTFNAGSPAAQPDILRLAGSHISIVSIHHTNGIHGLNLVTDSRW